MNEIRKSDMKRIEAILALIPTVALCILIIFIVSKIIKYS